MIPCKEEARHEKPSLLKYTVANELSSPQLSTIFAGPSQSKHPYPVLDPHLGLKWLWDCSNPKASLNSLWDLIYIYTRKLCVPFCLGGVLRRLPKLAPAREREGAPPFVRCHPSVHPPMRTAYSPSLLHPARRYCIYLPSCVLLTCCTRLWLTMWSLSLTYLTYH